jgi:hypothetical protein
MAVLRYRTSALAPSQAYCTFVYSTGSGSTSDGFKLSHSGCIISLSTCRYVVVCYYIYGYRTFEGRQVARDQIGYLLTAQVSGFSLGGTLGLLIMIN